MSYKTKNILKHVASAIVLLVVFVLPIWVGAQPTTPTTGGVQTPTTGNPIKFEVKIDNPFKQGTIVGLIDLLINQLFIPIGGVIAVLMIMYAGFQYVTARGDAAQVKKATEALKYAVIGAVILIGAKVISAAISATVEQLKS